MRLIDADELIEHVWRDKLDSRELIAKMINDAPTVKEISIKIPINIFEQSIKDLTEKIEKLKAELDYAKFRCALPSIMDIVTTKKVSEETNLGG